MTRYQLAKLVSWAETVKGRKRLQKVVFLLQAAGCDLDAEFFLHHYGPYSQDVAQLTDEMTRLKLLIENSDHSGPYEQFTYYLSEDSTLQLEKLDKSQDTKYPTDPINNFESQAKRFFSADLRELEYGATILYFKQQGMDWEIAAQKAVDFKATDRVRDALPFAKSVMPNSFS